MTKKPKQTRPGMITNVSSDINTSNNEGRCEACRRAPVEAVVTDDHQESPYHLCHDCERRLRAYALRPLEWFNLAGRHGAGSSGFLDDDFYDEDGTANQPDEEVEAPEKYPAPTLEQVEGDLERLVDYAMTRYFLTPEVVAALGRHPKKAVLLTLEKRVEATRSTAAESTAYAVCAQVVGVEAEAWVKKRWEQYRPEILHALAEASARCLPFEEGFERVTATLEGLSAKELDTHCFTLADFRSERTLGWIEAHRELARTDTWGTLAALSRFSWPKAKEWLEMGRPLSHVALAALQAGLRYDTHITKRYQPVLENPALVEEMAAALEAYLEHDPVPNVRNRVRSIQKKWRQIA